MIFFPKSNNSDWQCCRCKTKQVKGNTQNWLDGENLEKLFEPLERTRL